MRGLLGIGGHTRPNKGEHIIWLTPRALIEVLGPFDMDPCAAPSPRPWATAKRHIELPDNGLARGWEGRVWLNPPYDEHLHAWMKRMYFHGSGIALTFARTETEIWQKWIWPAAHRVMFISGRLYFCYPDGTEAEGNAGGPSALISCSEKDTEILRKSGISGVIVKPERD